MRARVRGRICAHPLEGNANTMIYADHELVHLGMANQTMQRVMAPVYRAQILTFSQTGHILSIREPEVYGYLSREKRHNRLPGVIVHCLRCGAQALLLDWVQAVDLGREGRAYQLDFHAPANEIDHDYLRDCPGDAVALAGCDVLGITRTE